MFQLEAEFEEPVTPGPKQLHTDQIALSHYRDVLWDTFPYSLHEGLWKLRLHYGYLWTTMHEMLREFCSLAHRMRMLWKMRQRLSTIYLLGPVFGEDPNGHLVRCRKTLGRTQGTQDLLANPKASRMEVQLFLEGWEKGAEWESHCPHTCNPNSRKRLSAASGFLSSKTDQQS